MKLLDSWRRAHRMFSVQAMTLAAAIQGAWTQVPQDLKDALPHNLAHWTSIVLLVAGILGRFIDQGAVTAPKETP